MIDKFAERGLRSLAVARQVCKMNLYSVLVPLSTKLPDLISVFGLSSASTRENKRESRDTMAVCWFVAII